MDDLWFYLAIAVFFMMLGGLLGVLIMCIFQVAGDGPTLPSDQSWYWSKEWQEKETEEVGHE
jgi:hypothetical protein